MVVGDEYSVDPRLSLSAKLAPLSGSCFEGN